MKHDDKKCSVAIIGTGNIGIDLLYKVRRSSEMYVKYFVGRNKDSKGISIAKKLGVKTSFDGISFLVENNDYDIVFDATSASDHVIHAPIFRKLDKKVVDLTPSNIGNKSVPSIKINTKEALWNANMITCGGQASLPIIDAIVKSGVMPDYVEIVTSIASDSAGIATRRNIDEYINTTESAVKSFFGIEKVKVILNLNPAEPKVNMQTTIYCRISNADINVIASNIDKKVDYIQSYVPGYKLALKPIYIDSILTTSVMVSGSGDYLPEYAGNLDIITCGAVEVAKKMIKGEV